MKNKILLLCIVPLLMNAQFDNSEYDSYSSVKNSILYNNGTQKLYPSVLAGVKINQNGLAILSFGIVPQKRKPFLLYSEASQKVKTQKFEFDFGTPILDDLAIQDYDRYFRGSKSPKEFLLIKLTQNLKKDRRYLLKQKGSWSPKIIAASIPFSFTEIESGLFKVTPNKNLEKGEYCFVHQDILTSNNFKEFVFFDFSIAE